MNNFRSNKVKLIFAVVIVMLFIAGILGYENIKYSDEYETLANEANEYGINPNDYKGYILTASDIEELTNKVDSTKKLLTQEIDNVYSFANDNSINTRVSEDKLIKNNDNLIIALDKAVIDIYGQVNDNFVSADKSNNERLKDINKNEYVNKDSKSIKNTMQAVDEYSESLKSYYNQSTNNVFIIIEDDKTQYIKSDDILDKYDNYQIIETKITKETYTEVVSLLRGYFPKISDNYPNDAKFIFRVSASDKVITESSKILENSDISEKDFFTTIAVINLNNTDDINSLIASEKEIDNKLEDEENNLKDKQQVEQEESTVNDYYSDDSTSSSSNSSSNSNNDTSVGGSGSQDTQDPMPDYCFASEEEAWAYGKDNTINSENPLGNGFGVEPGCAGNIDWWEVYFY